MPRTAGPLGSSVQRANIDIPGVRLKRTLVRLTGAIAIALSAMLLAGAPARAAVGLVAAYGLNDGSGTPCKAHGMS